MKPQRLRQFQPDDSNRYGNATARPEHLIEIAIFRGVEVVGVATKAQLGVEVLPLQIQDSYFTQFDVRRTKDCQRKPMIRKLPK